MVLMCSQAQNHGPLWGSPHDPFSNLLSFLPFPTGSVPEAYEHVQVSPSGVKCCNPLKVLPSCFNPIHNHMFRRVVYTTPMISTFYACLCIHKFEKPCSPSYGFKLTSNSNHSYLPLCPSGLSGRLFSWLFMLPYLPFARWLLMSVCY